MVVAAALVPVVVEAQAAGTALTWGLMGGVNMAKQNSEGAEMRMGFDLGLTAQKQLNATWSLNTGTHWTTKGTKVTAGGIGEATMSLSYLEVPILFRRTKASGDVKPFFELGSALAFNMSCTMEANIMGIPLAADSCGDAESGLNKLDAGLVIGAGIEVRLMGRPATLGVRRNQGLMSIAEGDEVLNSNLQFLMGFRFK